MLFFASIFSFILFVNVTVAAKIRSPALGIKFDSSSALPTLTLPYGTWRAFSYDSVNDIYLFQNIRFAASPVGNLRWAKPAPPTYNATIQDGSYGPQCLQGQFPGDPLFRKAVMQSIATELLVDRRGEIEGIYQEFLAAANCSGQSIACLRAASSETLQAANLKVIADVPPSAFKPSPSSDGKWVRQMPPLELASGNFFPIESLIVSHVENEGAVFVTGQIQTEAAFATLVDFIIPAYAPTVRQTVLNFYPDPSVPGSPYATENARTTQYLDDTNFLCNYRYLNTAYKGKVWSMQYSVPPGLHGSDLTPTFFLGNDTAANISTFTGNLYRDYQSYITSFSIYGSPDAARLIGDQPPTINWPKSTGENLENLKNVLNITGTGFEIINDGESLKNRCDFFLSVQAAVTLAGGYVPPGGAVPNDLGVTNPDPSGNYSTPR